MSLPAITIPPPASSVAAVEPRPHWWQRRSTWSALGSVLLAAPEALNQIAPFLPSNVAHICLAAAVLLANVAALYARAAGIDAAAKAHAVVAGITEYIGANATTRR